MPRITKLQRDLCRQRLSAYRQTNPGEGRPVLSWDEVRMDIADVTGVNVPAERLRQFVEGVSRKNGRGPCMLAPDRLTAVRDFLMHEEINLISDEEWAAQPRGGFVSVMVRIPLANVLSRGSQALLDRIELEPLALVIDDDEPDCDEGA